MNNIITPMSLIFEGKKFYIYCRRNNVQKYRRDARNTSNYRGYVRATDTLG